MALVSAVALATRRCRRRSRPVRASTTSGSRSRSPTGTRWASSAVSARSWLTHLTASEREPAAVRVAAAAGLPIVAVTLYFTFSRGGIAAAIVGLVLYLLLAHPRGLLGAFPAAGLPVAFALQQRLRLRAAGSQQLRRSGAREQGRALLVVVIGCVGGRGGAARALAARRPAAPADPHRCPDAAPRVRRRGDRGAGGLRDRHPGPGSPGPPRRSAGGVRARQHAARRPGPALAADQGRQQRSPRDLAGRARRRGGAALARRRAPARTGCSGSAAAPLRPRTSSTRTRSTTRRGRSWAGSASCCW